jgi:anti-sigma regulatory factor (Ser/Thr protein kinase)
VTEVAVRLPATADAVPTARHVIDRLHPLEPHSDLTFRLRLLVTELVANCVRHAGLCTSDSIGLELRLGEDGARVEVTDCGRGFEPAGPFTEPPVGTSGRGLYLLDVLSDRWGVDRRGGRTRVWFELVPLPAVTE